MVKKYTYFVSFVAVFKDQSNKTEGNTDVTFPIPITNMTQVQAMQSYLKDKYDYASLVVMHYQLLNSN